jgi:hypothetical protein
MQVSQPLTNVAQIQRELLNAEGGCWSAERVMEFFGFANS